jgi:hypothetical protein
VRAATPYAAAAPATVSDELLSSRHWAAWDREGESSVDPRARRPAITDVRAESAGRGVLGARTPAVGASPAMTENVRRLTMQESPKFRFDLETRDSMVRLRRETMHDPFRFDSDTEPTAGKDAIWVLIVTLSSIAFSFVFACATPFAALGALAGTRMRRGAGLALIVAAWAANQLIGFLILSYPRTWDSFGWGAAIGVAALLATIAARRAYMLLQHPVASSMVALATAFVIYEGALFAATVILPSSAAAFSLPVVARILVINVGAFAGLLVIQRLAVWFGLQQEPRLLRPALGA